MSDVYAGCEPRELWRHFAALNAIPRMSKREAAARDYVLRVAGEAGAECAVDARGNAVVRVRPSPGCELAPPVAVQAHLDMVCEKRPEVEHDFLTDPIRPRVEGDLVFASGTTLGADNGIGAAAALALLTTPGLPHPPLELLFTVEEETGLHGAAALDPSLLRARMLLNLDSEDPRDLTIGCAGGGGVILTVPVTREPLPPGWILRRLSVSGLKGGHSGVQIHERLANAIQLLARALVSRAGVAESRLVSVRGGNAHNAIPRDASAVLALPPEAAGRMEEHVERLRDRLRAEWGEAEPGLDVSVTPAASEAGPLDPESDARIVLLLMRLPHGVLKMSDRFPGKVETSSNLAMVGTRENEIEVATSSRSFRDDELRNVQQRIRELGEAAGARIEVRDGYGGWAPDPDSRLLATARRVYRETFGEEPRVQVIHAGLECGVIVRKLPGMEAISFGPQIRGAHTPEENVSISSTALTWKLLTSLLAALASLGSHSPGPD